MMSSVDGWTVSPRKSRKKSRVLLEHHDVDAGAREQEAEHHPGGPAAGDAAARLDRRHADCGPEIARSMYGAGSSPPPGGA